MSSCNAACQCVKTGVCSPEARNAIRDSRIENARFFLAEQKRRQTTEPTIDTTVTDVNGPREAVLRDLLSADDWSYLERLGATTTDAHGPLEQAQISRDAATKAAYANWGERKDSTANVSGVDGAAQAQRQRAESAYDLGRAASSTARKS